MVASPNIARPLLKWYDQHQRTLPWRKAGQEPYRVWLSEIMLQQTTVAAVIPYYERFLRKWPTLEALAKAKQEEVLAAWAGLGYYSRARNLYKCAGQVMALGGVFPQNERDLLKLAGIGAYTAAALMAIAFNKPANVVDGNVERVIARLCASKGDKKQLKALAAQFVPQKRCGDYAQALMDLGATVCTPRSPQCSVCPLRSVCQADAPEAYPVRGMKKERPVRRAVAYVLSDKDGRYWLRRRPETGLLAGMLEFPWEGEPPFQQDWLVLAGEVKHTFTHFDLFLKVAVATVKGKKLKGVWLTAPQIANEAVPSVMKKVLKHALSDKMP